MALGITLEKDKIKFLLVGVHQRQSIAHIAGGLPTEFQRRWIRIAAGVDPDAHHRPAFPVPI